MSYAHRPCRPRSRAHSTRHGTALAMIVIVMASLGVLAAGMFLGSVQHYRDAGRALRRVRVLAAAEAELYDQLTHDHWSAEWNVTPHRGRISVRSRAVEATSSPGVDTVTVWKTTRTAFTVTSRAVIGGGPLRARHGAALLVALRVPSFEPAAVITVRTTLRASEHAVIDGRDTVLPDWDCPPAGAPVAGVASAAAESLDTSGCIGGMCVVPATPPIISARAADAATYITFGQTTRSALLAAATALPGGAIVARPVVDSRGDCDTDDPMNFGDPRRLPGAASPCADYFPIRWATGNIHLPDGVVQGTLIVDGDLTVDGGAEIAGLVIVSGAIHVAENASLVGAVLASRAIVDGHGSLRFSRCVVARALYGVAVPTVPAGVTWTDIY